MGTSERQRFAGAYRGGNSTDKESIKRLYLNETKTIEQIAENLGLTVWKVRRVLNQEKVEIRHGHSGCLSPRWKAELDEAIRKLYIDEGLTLNEIGNKLSCDHRTIESHLKAQGIVPDPKRRRAGERHPLWKLKKETLAHPADWEMLEELYIRRRLSITAIASCLGCTRSTVTKHLKLGGVMLRGYPRGSEHPAWKGGRKKDGAGYIRVYAPGHPRALNKSYVFEHILVWERANSKPLPEGWIIHHINGVRDDNRPENLMAMPLKCHQSELKLKAGQRRIRYLEAKLKGVQAQQKLI